MSDLTRAREFLESGGYTYVLIKDDCILRGYERGVAPLLSLIGSGKDLRDFSAADKVVGKAAALLYAFMGIKAVYAKIMSEGAVEILRERGITFNCESVTTFISNCKCDGICPMEQAVADIIDPSAAVVVLRERVAFLSGN